MNNIYPKLRIRISLEKILDFKNENLGVFDLILSEEMMADLQPLPKDREIMEEMSEDFIYAHHMNELYKEQDEKRERTIHQLSEIIHSNIQKIIEDQDTVNGYPKK